MKSPRTIHVPSRPSIILWSAIPMMIIHPFVSTRLQCSISAGGRLTFRILVQCTLDLHRSRMRVYPLRHTQCKTPTCLYSRLLPCPACKARSKTPDSCDPVCPSGRTVKVRRQCRISPPPGVVMSQRSPTSGAEVIPGGSFWMGDGVRPRELEVQQSSPDPQECFGPQLNFDVSSGEGVSRHIDMLSRIKANADPESMGRPENHPMEFTGSVHTMSFASSPVAPHTHPAVEVHSQRKKRERVSGSDPRSVSALLATPACAIISLLLAGAETRQSKAETRG